MRERGTEKKNIKMSSEASVGKKLSELRVCDLKAELEKRNLETSGIKIALSERLQKVRVTGLISYF